MKVRNFGLMKARVHFVFTIASLTLASLARADEVDDLIAKTMASLHLPGLSLTVVKDGKILRSQGYGYANLETKTKVTPDTVFEVGSITKQFTSTLILKLASEGKLSLEDSLSKYFDNLPDALKPITIRRCLSHTAGLYEYLGIGMDPRKDHKPEAILDMVKQKPLDFKPGDAWSYSNAGYAIGGLIIEKLTKKPWGEGVQSAIFDQVGMKESYIQNVPRVIENRATGYTWSGKVQTNSEILRPGSAYAAGAILSTGPDMAKWTTALSAGKFPGVAQAWEPIKLSEGRTYPYGMGWFLGKAWGQPVVLHGGNTYGFSAQISRYPQEGLSVIILTNAAGQGYVRLADLVAKQYLKNVVVTTHKPLPDPNKPRTSKLIDALEEFKMKNPDPNLVGVELRSLMGTLRGTSLKSSIRNTFGPIKALIYMGEEKEGDDTMVFYEVVGGKTRAKMQMLVDRDNRLIRLAGLAE